MNKFELITIIISAGLAGAGISVYMQGDLAMAFICVGASIKLIAGLGNMARININDLLNASSVEELDALLMKEREKNKEKNKIFSWLSEFATYLILGGFFLLIVEAFQKF